MPKPKLYATALVAGYATLTLESTGTALLAPYFGATSTVWTVQIAIALLGVFLGYLLGQLLPRVSIGTWLLAGGAYTFVLTQLASSLLPLTYTLPYWTALLTTATLLYLPGSTLINACYPTLAANASSKSQDAFVTVSATATIGAILALANNLWLPDKLGLRLALSLGAILVAATGLWHNRPSLTAGWFATFSLMTAIFPTAGPAAPTTETARWETADGLTQTIETDGRRMLMHNGICQTLETPTHQAAPLIETAIALAEHTGAHQALAIGVGGGSFPTRLAGLGIICDSVDTSPTMIKAATKCFAFNPHRTTLTDGRRFLATTTKSYDFVFLDAFTGDEPASHLLSQEAAKQIKAHLTQGGHLAINLVATTFEPLDPLNSSVIKTFRTAFPYVSGWQIGDNNLLVVAGNTPVQRPPELREHKESRQGVLLTDNKNPARHLYGTTGQALRQKQRDSAKAG